MGANNEVAGMSLKDILVNMVIPRIDALDSKLSTKIEEHERQFVDWGIWRGRVNGGLLALAAGVPIVVTASLSIYFGI